MLQGLASFVSAVISMNVLKPRGFLSPTRRYNLKAIILLGDCDQQNTQGGNNCLFLVSTDIMVLIVGGVSMNSAVLHNESSGVPRQTQGAGPSKQLLYPGEGQEHSHPEFRGSLFGTPRVHSNEVKSEHDLAPFP